MGALGKKDRFGKLLLRHRKIIWSVCYKYAQSDKKLLEDLAQEVMMALYIEFDDLREDANYIQEYKWVKWRSQVAARKSWAKYRFGYSELDEDTLSPLAITQYLDEEQKEDIMSHLSDDEREVVQFWLDGYSGDEAAEKMNISPDAYYQRKHRIIQKLKDIYNNE